MSYNSFMELDPEFKTFDDTSYEFNEDMFQAVHEGAKMIIGLGWYPAHRAAGRYGLVAVRLYPDEERMSMSWYRPLMELRTRSRQTVVKAIEQWMGWYNSPEAFTKKGEPRPYPTKKVMAVSKTQAG